MRTARVQASSADFKTSQSVCADFSSSPIRPRAVLPARIFQIRPKESEICPSELDFSN